MIIHSNSGTSIVVENEDSIVKCISHDINEHYRVYENELHWLKLLKLDWIPKVRYSEYCMIVMDNKGETLTRENAPSDLKLQLNLRIHQLHFTNCYHNDIKPGNILIKKGKVNIIDFGWATDKPEIPEHWPEKLGGDFRADNGFNDFESADKVMELINKTPSPT